MITRIEAFRYRCFEQLDVQVGQYQVLAGVNGSGKTTLLDIPVLLGNILDDGLTAAFLQIPALNGSPRAQSLQELVHHQQGNFFSLALEVTLPEFIVAELLSSSRKVRKTIRDNPKKHPRSVRYELRFEIFNQTALQVRDEYLYLIPAESSQARSLQSIGQPIRGDWTTVISREGGATTTLTPEFIGKKGSPTRLDTDVLALKYVLSDREQFPATVWFREFLQRGVMHYAPSGSALRKPCPPSATAIYLSPNGANLPWLVMRLKQEQAETFEEWVNHVQTALPNIVSIDGVEREEDHFAYLKVVYVGGYTVTSSGLSDGTLHILALTILPYLRRVPGLISVEEPENGIHPRAIETVLQSLRSVYDSQVWVTTHSPIVLAHTDLADVMVTQCTDGSAIALRGAEHPRLKDWQGSIDLGSLFAAGVLG